MSDIKEDAEQLARECYCDGCGAIGCCDEDICDGFKEEVKSIIQEWEKE